MDNITLQLLVGATTGALAVVYVFGLRSTAKIFQIHRGGVSWHMSIKDVLGRKIGSWACFIFASLLNLTIVAGIVLPIFLT
jgi:hypothetical protein